MVLDACSVDGGGHASDKPECYQTIFGDLSP